VKYFRIIGYAGGIVALVAIPCSQGMPYNLFMGLLVTLVGLLLSEFEKEKEIKL